MKEILRLRVILQKQDFLTTFHRNNGTSLSPSYLPVIKLCMLSLMVLWLKIVGDIQVNY